MAKAKAIERHSATLNPPINMLGKTEFPGKLNAASCVRMFVHDLLSGRTDDDRLDDALLLVTELFSNSVRHSDSGRDPNGKISIQVADIGGYIHIQVIDQGSAHSAPYVIADDGQERCGGFGLRLVEQIASAWGHHDHNQGHRLTWFDLATPTAYAKPRLRAAASAKEQP